MTRRCPYRHDFTDLSPTLSLLLTPSPTLPLTEYWIQHRVSGGWADGSDLEAFDDHQGGVVLQW